MSIHTANTDRIIIQWYAYETILDALNEIYSAILTQCATKKDLACVKNICDLNQSVLVSKLRLNYYIKYKVTSKVEDLLSFCVS